MENKNKLAVGYCRSATTDQTNSGHSLNIQEKICLKHAKNDGYKKIKIIREVASGATLKRKGIQEVIKLIKKNRIHSLYVVDVDRLSRNARDYTVIKKLCERHYVKLKVINY